MRPDEACVPGTRGAHRSPAELSAVLGGCARTPVAPEGVPPRRRHWSWRTHPSRSGSSGSRGICTRPRPSGWTRRSCWSARCPSEKRASKVVGFPGQWTACFLVNIPLAGDELSFDAEPELVMPLEEPLTGDRGYFCTIAAVGMQVILLPISQLICAD